MSCDKENRWAVHQFGASVATRTNDGDGLERLELVDGAATTMHIAGLATDVPFTKDAQTNCVCNCMSGEFMLGGVGIGNIES